jgi:two-component system, OmpR family, response regulator
MFRARFRLARNAISITGKRMTTTADPHGGAAGKNRRILLVDDSADAAIAMSMLLEALGHEVRTEHDGPRALAALDVFRPEVVVLDIGLPGMSGYELAQRLRGMPELDGIRLVAVTGYGQPEDYQRTREAGFDEHLVKPVEQGSLERSLAALRHKGGNAQ